MSQRGKGRGLKVDDEVDDRAENSDPRADNLGQRSLSMPESAAVALAAVLDLFRLTGAELVMTQLGGETDRFEEAVRTKIAQFVGPSASKAAREEGVALARHLVEQVLAQIKAQAEVKRRLRATPSTGSSSPEGRLLN